MSSWPKQPVIYEINCWVWLRELGNRLDHPITLATVPCEEWELLAGLGMDAVWLMGIWERSPAGIAIAGTHPGLLADFRRALPGFVPADNVGSPYCIRRYRVDHHLGGDEGLAITRRELQKRGIRLILDFVPNHLATDHPWVTDHPEFFIPGSDNDNRVAPASFREAGGRLLACGRDPYFPPWPDVLQLNAFDPGLRKAAVETLSAIADRCDGVRCDMAMLVMNDIFAKTWGERVGPQPDREYWPEVIGALRSSHPGFLFMAEAYWDREWALQQQGFDYCYDKRLYDRLAHGSTEELRRHLGADLAYQERLVRFMENHDEPRAAATFSREQAKAVAVIVATLPGAVLLHEGQLEGRRIRLPLFLHRRPAEPPDQELREFHVALLRLISREGVKSGRWSLCHCEGGDESGLCNLVAWSWEEGERGHLVVVNLSPERAPGWITLPPGEFAPVPRRLRALPEGEILLTVGGELGESKVTVNLPPWGFQIFALGTQR